MLSRLLANRGGWWLLVGVLALSCAAVAGLTAGGGVAGGVAGGCAAAAVLGLAWALQLREDVRERTTRHQRAAALAEARATEVGYLASTRLPEIIRRVSAGQRLDGAPGQLAPPTAVGEDFTLALASVVNALGSDDAVRRERALRDSVQAAFESVARNMHAMATVQLQVLDNVEKIISDPRLMSEVMRADHAAAQMTRKAQTLLVMCGIWPARRESRPVSLYDCVRGAQSRIVEFGRVEVHGGQTLYAVPPAVEGTMHALAELLENATVFSPSSTQVVVTVREVGAGAVIEIDDAGLGMPPDTLHQALGQLRDDVDLATLGAVPRLGLACVGRWARELGLNVELTGASAYGGTRAVMFVPHRLLTEPVVPEPQRTAAPTRHAQAGPGQTSAGYASGYAESGAVHGGAPAYAPEGRRAAPHPEFPDGQRPGAAGEDRTPYREPAPYGDANGPAYSGGYADDAPPGDARDAAPAPAPAPAPANLPVRQRSTRSAPLPPVAGPGALPPQSGAPQDAGQDVQAESDATLSGLPKRRSRRREPGAGPLPSPGQPPQLSGSFEAFRAARPAAREPVRQSDWTPEAARASVASVLSGTRRGRAELADTPRGELAVPDDTRDPQGARPGQRPPHPPHAPLPEHSPHPYYGDQP